VYSITEAEICGYFIFTPQGVCHAHAFAYTYNYMHTHTHMHTNTYARIHCYPPSLSQPECMLPPLHSTHACTYSLATQDNHVCIYVFTSSTQKQTHLYSTNHTYFASRFTPASVPTHTTCVARSLCRDLLTRE